LVIDVATRAVTSFYVGLEEPSIVRAAAAIDLGVQVKDDWLARTGLCAGVAELGVSDTRSHWSQ
jgi:hypothetical protein